MRSVLRTFARLVCCVGLATFGLLSGCCPSPPTAEPAPDLAPPSDLGADPGPTCQAAMGLAADKRLLCADFTTSLPASGWTFPANCGADTWQWTILGGALTLSSFGTFGDPASMNPMERACSFTSPSIEAGPYATLTLSVLQSVDLRIDPAVQQRAQILLDAPSTLLTESTGKTPSLRRSTVTISASEVDGKSLKFNLVTRSLSGGGYTGWQIKSIAVLGHK